MEPRGRAAPRRRDHTPTATGLHRKTAACPNTAKLRMRPTNGLGIHLATCCWTYAMPQHTSLPLWVRLRSYLFPASGIAALCLAACASSTSNSESSAPEPAPANEPASGPSSGPASGPAAAMNNQTRAQRAETRLSASPAGQHIMAATQTHGGLEAFYGLDSLSFHYRYAPVEGPVRASQQTIRLADAVAHHTMTEPEAAEFAWDGTQAWLRFKDGRSFDEKKPPFAARFWALTPYYFVGMPFVLADPGVILKVSQDDPTKVGLPAGTVVVEASFGAGVGDAPDDTYVLYLDAKTHQLLALRYTVSYAAFFRGSEVKRTPEKLMVFSDPIKLNGVTLFKTQTTFAMDGDAKGKHVTNAAVSELAAVKNFQLPPKPEGALIDRSLD